MVQNIIADTYARIEFYDGDPKSGGRLIRWRRLFAEAISQNETGIEFKPSSPGEHTIHILASAITTHEEYTNNNQTTLTVQVEAGT